MSVNDYEKQQYAVAGETPSDHAVGDVTDTKGNAINEAAGVYGSVQKAEDYGYVQRGLKSRHIQFIALGGTIGTGLFLGIGKAFANAGPVSVLLGYTITGVAVFGMMQCLGEMATWLPLPGAIPQYAARYADPALGFAVGWNNWYNSSITLCAEISAAALLINFWDQEEKRGFRYWKEGAMKEYVGTGSTGRFTGLWSTLVNAAFSYGGVEMVAVAAGEAANPRKNRSFIIGTTISSNDPQLTDDNAKGAQSSPWVIAMKNAGIPVLPHIVNAVILTSATSSGNAFLYTGSRYLFSIAQNGQAPQFLLRCNKKGVPIYAVAVTASISLLTYMSVSAGANKVFGWFQNLTTIASLFTWCTVTYTYTRFRKACIAQNVDRSTMVFASKWQPYVAWTAFTYFALIILFNGFKVFTTTPWGPDELTDFFTAYIGVAIFGLLFAFWKVFKRTKMVNPAEADIWSGKAALDAEVWPEQIPRNALERFWFWLC
ncbi:amino acid permease [Alternaria alternata]|nr:amino acid permease [Alternaria alternata]